MMIDCDATRLLDCASDLLLDQERLVWVVIGVGSDLANREQSSTFPFGPITYVVVLSGGRWMLVVVASDIGEELSHHAILAVLLDIFIAVVGVWYLRCIRPIRHVCKVGIHAVLFDEYEGVRC
jgi:hypothetical protein